MISPDDIQKYIQCMQEIKARIAVIEGFLSKRVTTGQGIPDVECIALQFRMVFELIALSSLCANRDQYEAVKATFHREWDANKIIAKVESLNPTFYPAPVRQVLHPKTGQVIEVKALTEGFLTKDEYRAAYNTCHDFLHAQNPYAWKAPDFPVLQKTFEEWKTKLVMLLSIHLLPYQNGPWQLWVIMHDKNKGEVVVHEMVRVDRAQPPNET